MWLAHLSPVNNTRITILLLLCMFLFGLFRSVLVGLWMNLIGKKLLAFYYFRVIVICDVIELSSEYLGVIRNNIDKAYF